MNEMLLGAAYYPEHDPESEWERDAPLMRELGLNCVRIGEFCWSRMQGRDGRFTLDWIGRCVELFDRHGIKTILCTPTAAPPAWLAERYPDLACVAPDGRHGLFGGRRHYSVFHKAYREHCAAIAAALAERFGKHPAVIGWQIDNEVGSYFTADCSPPALAAFRRWIERKYGTVAELNRRWGLIFWNQEVDYFDQVPAPTEMMCTRNPSYLLDYNRFCLEGMADFLLLQAEAIRRHAPPETQFVVASAIENVLRTLFRRQRERNADWVNAVTVHNYPELNPEPAQAAMMLDRFRSLRDSGDYLALEHQVGSGYTTTGGLNPAVRRYWSFETLAHGARAILWFHWRRFRSGCEWRLTSVVERDRLPREPFRGIQAIVRDMRRVQDRLAGGRVKSNVQVLYSLDNALAHDRASEPVFWMAIQLPDAQAHRVPMWERAARRAVYNPLLRLGLTVGFVSEEDDWDPGQPLFVPELDLCTPDLARKLADWCTGGGTLVCLPGVGERDECGAQRDAPPPGILGELFGVRLKEYYPLEPDGSSAFDHQAGRATESAGTRPDATVARVRVGEEDIAFDVRHGEVLEPRDAEVLGRYHEGLYRGEPALTVRRVGAGRAFYLGAVPADADAAVRLYRRLLFDRARKESPCQRVRWESLSGPLAFLLNGAPHPARLAAPVRDLISGTELTELPPWGVALIEGGG